MKVEHNMMDILTSAVVNFCIECGKEVDGQCGYKKNADEKPIGPFCMGCVAKDINKNVAESSRRMATDNQPPPERGSQYVTVEVIKDMAARSAMGRKKYGTVLMTNNGRDALMDAYQEALDLAMYLKQAIMERR